MSHTELLAANVTAPVMGQIAVIALTTSSSRTNLAAAAQLGTLAQAGHYLTFEADGGDVYLFLNREDAGTADETATTGNDRVVRIPQGQFRDWRLVKDYTWVVAKASVACHLRVSVSSGDDLGGIGLG